jgi:hypothetical protein
LKPEEEKMKRTLIASHAAGMLAAPAAHAGPYVLDVFGEFELPSFDELGFAPRDLLAAADDAKVHAEAMRSWAESFTHDLTSGLTMMYGPRMSSSRIVKGAPYSAEVVTETSQSLADGNVIAHRSVGAVYRDGEGRTRQEAPATGKRDGAIYISDPVESKSIVLLPGAKRAVVSPRVFSEARTRERTKEKQVVKVGKTEVRIENGRVYLDGRDVTSGNVEVTSGGKEIRVENGRVTIDGKELGGGDRRVHVTTLDGGDGTRREEIRVQVIRAGDKEITIPLPPTPPVPPVPPVPPLPPHAPMAVPPLPPMPGLQTLRFESTARLGKGTTTALGMKDFDGVKAEGKSTVWTIPAGEIGNRNPIQITSESWYAPDLQVTVYSRYHDPRTGESTYRLAGIRRGEPSRDLFTVPAGYETKERGKREERK